MSKNIQSIQTVAEARGLSVGQMLRRAWLSGVPADDARSVLTKTSLAQIDKFLTLPEAKTESARKHLTKMASWARLRAIFLLPEALENSQLEFFWAKMIPLLNKHGGTLLIPSWALDEAAKKGKSSADGLKTRVELLQKAGVARVLDAGGKKDFLSYLQRYLTSEKTLVVTKSSPFVQDAYKLKGAENLTVCRMARWGYLEEIVAAHSTTAPTQELPFDSQKPDSAATEKDKGKTAGVPAPQRPSVPGAFQAGCTLTNVRDTTLGTSLVPGTGHIVTTRDGQKIKLMRELAAGGEGAVFDIGSSDLVAKIYKKERLTQRRMKKLELMLSRKIERKGICYPTELLYNNRKQFVGFLMPKARGDELKKTVMVPEPVFKKKNPLWQRRELVRLCLAILHHIKYLHERNILIGDINALNILVVSPDEVYFVDADSYQVEGFPCPVGTNEFIAPELQGRSNFSGFLRSWGHENFAIAVLLFMIMMPGRHPYSRQGGGSTQENIRSGNFPYPHLTDAGSGVPQGKWLKMWNLMPFFIRDAFYRSFKKGERYQSENDRLSVDAWIDKFKTYLSQLNNPPPQGLEEECRVIYPRSPGETDRPAPKPKPQSGGTNDDKEDGRDKAPLTWLENFLEQLKRKW